MRKDSHYTRFYENKVPNLNNIASQNSNSINNQIDFINPSESLEYDSSKYYRDMQQNPYYSNLYENNDNNPQFEFVDETYTWKANWKKIKNDCIEKNPRLAASFNIKIPRNNAKKISNSVNKNNSLKKDENNFNKGSLKENSYYIALFGNDKLQDDRLNNTKNNNNKFNKDCFLEENVGFINQIDNIKKVKFTESQSLFSNNPSLDQLDRPITSDQKNLLQQSKASLNPVKFKRKKKKLPENNSEKWINYDFVNTKPGNKKNEVNQVVTNVCNLTININSNELNNSMNYTSNVTASGFNINISTKTDGEIVPSNNHAPQIILPSYKILENSLIPSFDQLLNEVGISNNFEPLQPLSTDQQTQEDVDSKAASILFELNNLITKKKP